MFLRYFWDTLYLAVFIFLILFDYKKFIEYMESDDKRFIIRINMMIKDS